jgi:hypothetical protein
VTNFTCQFREFFPGHAKYLVYNDSACGSLRAIALPPIASWFLSSAMLNLSQGK